MRLTGATTPMPATATYASASAALNAARDAQIMAVAASGESGKDAAIARRLRHQAIVADFAGPQLRQVLSASDCREKKKRNQQEYLAHVSPPLPSCPSLSLLRISKVFFASSECILTVGAHSLSTRAICCKKTSNSPRSTYKSPAPANLPRSNAMFIQTSPVPAVPGTATTSHHDSSSSPNLVDCT